MNTLEERKHLKESTKIFRIIYILYTPQNVFIRLPRKLAMFKYTKKYPK